MRDGNNLSGSNTSKLIIVFELPMRDGNSDVMYILPSTSFSFWTSYEGWKPGFTVGIACSGKVFELPMRDGNVWCPVRSPLAWFWFLNFLWGMETVRPDSPGRRRQTAFLNFLWGMETTPHWTEISLIPGFWTSYEGWKRTPWRDVRGCFVPVFELPMRDGNLPAMFYPISRQSRFWTSYEGWKQRDGSIELRAADRFWTSYEGWKQNTIPLWFQIEFVFELPMRDGNTIYFGNLLWWTASFWTSYEGWKPVLDTP